MPSSSSSHSGPTVLLFLLALSILECFTAAFYIRPTSFRLSSRHQARRDKQDDNAHIEYSALVKGQPISVQVGDVSLARKAWKKRRRSDSPILIPCTILGIDTSAALRFSIMHLVHAYGRKLNPAQQAFPYPNGDQQLVGDGVTLPLSSLTKLYNSHLQGDLLRHLDDGSSESLVRTMQQLFDATFQDDYGITVQLINATDGSTVPYLSSTLSYRPARMSAQQSILLQFVSPSSSSQLHQPQQNPSQHKDHIHSTFSMDHTGYTLLATSTNNTRIEKKVPVLLSAALKISQVDAESHRIAQGMILDAFILSFDSKGDNEAPLLTCALTLPNSIIRDQMRRRYHNRHIFSIRKNIQQEYSFWTNNNQPGRTHALQGKQSLARTNGIPKRSSDPKFDLVHTDKNYTTIDIRDLHVGDGPFRATVMRVVSSRNNKRGRTLTHLDAPVAFVDLGVSRKRGKKNGGGRARVYGMLVVDEERNLHHERGQDHHDNDDDDIFVDDNDEMEEDISAFFSVDETGNLIFDDFTDDKEEDIGDDDDDDDYEEMMDDTDDEASVFPASLKRMNASQRLEYIGDMFDKNVPVFSSPNDDGEKYKLEIGDELDVYIKAVFLQSGRFVVTQNSDSTKYILIKRQKEAEKRLSRLATKIPLSRITKSVGEESIGVIKAKSRSGLGYYVEPENDRNGLLTTGLAQPISSNYDALTQGNRVRIRLEGIDDERGQLLYTLLGILEDS